MLEGAMVRCGQHCAHIHRGVGAKIGFVPVSVGAKLYGPFLGIRELVNFSITDRFIQKFRGDSTFSTWIYRITVNTAWTLRKKAKKHYSLNIEDTQEPVVIDEKKDPEFLAMNSDLSSVLKKALDQIPIEQRIIVELKNIEGRSHKEIAEYLDISVTAAKVRLHRAHQKLRHILEEIDV